MASIFQDPTFRLYSTEQATNYLKHRTEYSPALYNFILGYHKSTGGESKVLVDVGCGPGQVTRRLAQDFLTAFGIDPGKEMLATARGLGGTSSTGEPIQYCLWPAEELDQVPQLRHGSVDLVTVAAAVSFFLMNHINEISRLIFN